MGQKVNEGKLKLPGGQWVSPEYVERLSRIVLAFGEGAQRLMGKDQTLYSKIGDLTRVIEKTLEPASSEGLGKEIEEYFDFKQVEDNYRVLEREGLLNIVRELTLTLKELSEPSEDAEKGIEHFIEEIEHADNLMDLRAIKDKIIQNTREVQKQFREMREELVKVREKAESLESKLEETEARVIIDSLTRVLNRSAYDMRVKMVVSEFQRFKEPATLAVVDIDNFKSINDEHGHQSGDNALVSIAQTIKDCIRESDVVFRYGGEEFVILFTKTGGPGAQVIAEKIREKVQSVRTHLVNDVYADKSKRVELTVSIGLAELKPEDDAKSWFQRADKKLYEAKQKGRNKVLLG